MFVLSEYVFGNRTVYNVNFGLECHEVDISVPVPLEYYV